MNRTNDTEEEQTRPELSDDTTEPLRNQFAESERDLSRKVGGEPKEADLSVPAQARLIGLDGCDQDNAPAQSLLAYSDDNDAPIPINLMCDQDSLAKDGARKRGHELSSQHAQHSQPGESDAEDSSQQSSIPEATFVAEEPIYHAEEVFEGSLAPKVYDGVIMDEDEASNLSEALLKTSSDEEEDAKRPWYRKNCFRKPRFSLLAVIIIVIVALLVMDDDDTGPPTKPPTKTPTGAPTKAPTSLRQRNMSSKDDMKSA
ncbi:hypothetical protein THAOC_04377 [Thalassiosira oceanica]|uniref:Uncharacterized protein n=1 Tax=Thalassiosira oceanica TaxID=159749 RepID=K0T8T8_THAOC|nr:hypothetical protein THAOC_04377 [Thalassiosira oceanica]|eukprot:EJK73975.1 hypothetical protein THAOC_04377 [Thalassiosira oceanica]